MYSCNCGKTYTKYKDLKRHCMAKEFEFSCKFCDKVFSSHDNRVRHHRKLHTNSTCPTPKYGVSQRSNNKHSSTSQIRHLRLRKVDQEDKEMTDNIIHWLNNIPDIPTPLALNNSNINIPDIPTPLPLDNSDIDFTITPASPLPPPLPILSFSDLLDNIDDTSDNIITTLATSPITSTLLQTPPLSPSMNSGASS